MNSVQMGQTNTNTQKLSSYKHKNVDPIYPTVINDNLGLDGQTINSETENLNDVAYTDEYVCNFSDDVNYDSNINLSKTYRMVSNVPLNMMPPPPHNIVNNNVILHDFNQRDRWSSGGEIRSNSPHGSESDESCRSFASRDSPPEEKSTNNKSAKNAYSTYINQAVLYNKLCSSSPSVFYGTGITQQSLNSITVNKSRNHHHNSGRPRRDDKRYQTNDINRRVFGLMERFTSKSKLFRIPPNPQRLLTGGGWDQLNKSIWDIYADKAQTEKIYIQKLDLWKMVYIQIRKILIRYGLFMVGSTMSGFGTEKSDMDMCLLVKPCLNDPRSDALSYLQSIQRVLSGCDFIQNPEVIMAKVPILKFTDLRYGFEVDLNCNNAVGIRNTHLLHCYAHLDWRVRPLVIIVKLWAQANNINNAKNMTISSYSLALMVIHFLQCGVSPPAIPCLHGLYPQKFNPNNAVYAIDMQEELPKFNSDNKQSLGELFLGFLHYYTVFNYDRYAISVREGTVLLKEECRMARSVKNDATQWKLLCIEEPFDLTNTARSVYDVDTFQHIKYVFHYSYRLLRETKDLFSILPHLDNQR